MTRTKTELGASRKFKPLRFKGYSKLPLDPERNNDERADTARKTLAYFRQLVRGDREDSIGDLISDMMHLCDRDPRYGRFEEKLDRGLHYYYEETLPDKLYMTRGNWHSPIPQGEDWDELFPDRHRRQGDPH